MLNHANGHRRVHLRAWGVFLAALAEAERDTAAGRGLRGRIAGECVGSHEVSD
jgi:hypothetical protein